MIVDLGKVSTKTQGCTQFTVEQDSSSPVVKYRTYTDGQGNFAGFQVGPDWFVVPGCG